MGAGGGGGAVTTVQDHILNMHQWLLIGEYDKSSGVAVNPSGDVENAPGVGANVDWVLNGGGTYDGPWGMADAMKTVMHGTSPYGFSEAAITKMVPDPEGHLAAIEAQVDKLDTLIETTLSFDASTMVTDALAAVATAIGTAPFTAIVDAFEARSLIRHNRSVARFQAGLADANAVMGSAFVIGEAIMESEFNKETNNYEQEVTKQYYLVLLLKHIEVQFQQDNLQVTSQIQRSQIYSKIKAARIAAELDEFINNVELGAKDTLWDIEVFTHGSNLLGSIQGSTSFTPPMSKTQSTLAGMASGAGMGAELGTMLPIPGGTAIGMGVGALLGGIAG